MSEVTDYAEDQLKRIADALEEFVALLKEEQKKGESK